MRGATGLVCLGRAATWALEVSPLVRFYDSTCERMERLTRAALRAGADGDAVREIAEAATARPVRDADRVHDELARNAEVEERGGG